MIELPIDYIEVERVYKHSLGRSIRSVAVTSTNSREGSTTMAYALSARAKSDGKNVLLVEMNLRHPEFGDLSGHKNDDWLPMPDSYSHSIIKDKKSSIDILPAPSFSNSLIFRNIGKMRNLLKHWLTQYDIVVFDTSPVQSVNRNNIPAEIIGSIVDGCLIMVMAGITKRPSLQDSVERLRKYEINILGFVYNDLHNPKLADELIRETYRLNKFFPNTMKKLRNYIKDSLFLNLEL